MPLDTTEVSERFAFGKNWKRYLNSINSERLSAAEQSLREMLEIERLEGKCFLDAGSGSGIFSLAARGLGARVHSFDYDSDSVACAEALKDRRFPDDPRWTIERASVLDTTYLSKLGQWDVVYCWGVAHHTGDMWRALGNVADSVAPTGKLFVAIYNDQGFISRYWLQVKRAYNSNRALRFAVTAFHLPYLFLGRLAVRALTGRLKAARGMSLWYDMIDWLGGYPFEVAKPEAVFDFFRKRGFSIVRLKTCGGRHGCNEFVFMHERGDSAGVGD
ncbi:MAG: class I SAM-dependent methyltransferase [Sulfuricaulis sp.]|uniref:class I SAM-dependent methyltransferase n=1 Tax=Sulfuricaulis sp. TaxID=2003553 RepID=UPI003C4813F1